MDYTLVRLKHSLAVAQKMKELSDLYSLDGNEMFLLGLLHDIGYEFSSCQEEHPEKGGILLKAQGYKYWKEVFYHGKAQNEYDSIELRLLNYVDFITNSDGIFVSFKERLLDIEDRYGIDSIQTKEATELMSMLLEQGFSDES